MGKVKAILASLALATTSLCAGYAFAGGFPPFNRLAGETPSGQPVPRFVSLKFSNINGRAGPDKDYPVRWVYKRKGLPVRVVAETDDWRRIEDPDGAVSWVHKRMLDGRRTGIARPSRDMRVAMRADASSDTRVVAYISDGVIVEITEERPGWRQVKAGRFKGWVPASELWGADNSRHP
ncbi:MAG: SH3 domain-containing protein [Hyphomonadaceae bacterium]|jgi:SH3-like domain-containing protein|uniref:SH3 domain-containing protein n=1 Tax=Aquidulcibacter sp. TaxID=2052990 RepID=UPI0022BF1CF8|nr:SH3 domain-containing protein [Aquidulcibacter sp.]MCE2889888.1 SH3 domain-containing protein [Hyphomonadaceae bacterium]MCZ8208220.1 SH3 domain-containing protein [Aquidulcibacter sp.]